MCVKKIVLSNPDIFKYDNIELLNNEEAYQIIAEHPSDNGNLRTAYLAICNLYELGLMDEATFLAKKALKVAASTYQYFIAADLSHRISTYYILIDDWQSSRKYHLLFERYTKLFSQHHETLHLFGQAIKNSPDTLSSTSEIPSLDKALNSIFSKNNPWLIYCQFLLKTFSLYEKELESELLLAIEYFEQLKHNYFAGSFYYTLIKYYIALGELAKAEQQLTKMKKGTWYWFKSYHCFATSLVIKKDLKANDVCNLVMDHPNYAFLDNNLKQEWKTIYKKAVKLLLQE